MTAILPACSAPRRCWQKMAGLVRHHTTSCSNPPRRATAGLAPCWPTGCSSDSRWSAYSAITTGPASRGGAVVAVHAGAGHGCRVRAWSSPWRGMPAMLPFRTWRVIRYSPPPTCTCGACSRLCRATSNPVDAAVDLDLHAGGRRGREPDSRTSAVMRGTFRSHSARRSTAQVEAGDTSRGRRHRRPPSTWTGTVEMPYRRAQPTDQRRGQRRTCAVQAANHGWPAGAAGPAALPWPVRISAPILLERPGAFMLDRQRSIGRRRAGAAQPALRLQRCHPARRRHVAGDSREDGAGGLTQV